MSKKSAPSAVAFAEDEDQDVLVFEDADEFMNKKSSAPMEDVQAKVQEAQAELLQLRQRQEEIERQKLYLEQVRHKQDRFGQGKRDLTEKLNRSILVIERDLYNTQKLVEELNVTHEAFARHLEVLRGLQPERWQRSQVDEELDRALAAIEDAEDDYVKSSRRLVSLRSEPASRSNRDEGDSRAARSGDAADDFMALVKRGFGLSLPLMVAGIVGLVLAKIMF